MHEPHRCLRKRPPLVPCPALRAAVGSGRWRRFTTETTSTSSGTSSNPGDVVLDPFCGCGTTIDAAQKLGRDWIGIDGKILFGDDPKAAISAGSESRYYRLIRN